MAGMFEDEHGMDEHDRDVCDGLCDSPSRWVCMLQSDLQSQRVLIIQTERGTVRTAPGCNPTNPPATCSYPAPDGLQMELVRTDTSKRGNKNTNMQGGGSKGEMYEQSNTHNLIS